MELPAINWLKQAGVDEVAAEKPKNFFEIKDENAKSAFVASAPAPAGSKNSKKVQPKKQLTMSEEMGFSEPQSGSYASLTDVIAEARALADSAETLEDLRKVIEAFDGCAVKKTANKTVFADGNPDAGVMLIGEAPGADEDRQGIPFCGENGELLNKILKSIGRDRESGFYITNTLFWRPPGNRKPTAEELAICKPFLEKHIALAKPKILLLVGATAVQAILEQNISMGKLRGKVWEYTNQYIEGDLKVMVTYHPSYLVRSPLNKRLAWDDMLQFQSEIASL